MHHLYDTKRGNPMRTKRLVTSLTAALLLAGGMSAGTAAAAGTASEAVRGGQSVTGGCPDTGNEVSVPGGYAEWDITCEKKGVMVRGWVKDTRADGKCARVTATNKGKTKRKSVCGWGDTKSFSWNLGKGSGAKVRLSTY